MRILLLLMILLVRTVCGLQQDLLYDLWRNVQTHQSAFFAELISRVPKRPSVSPMFPRRTLESHTSTGGGGLKITSNSVEFRESSHSAVILKGSSGTLTVNASRINVELIDTGNGASEVFAMDQPVTTTSKVSFSSVEASSLTVNGSSIFTWIDRWTDRCTSNFTTTNGIEGGATTFGGDSYIFMCLPGYVPSGVATCSSGQWNSPFCVWNETLSNAFPLSYIYSIPVSTSDYIEASPASEIISHTDTSGITTGDWKWFGGVLGPNGKIYGIPDSAEAALIIDTTNNDAVSSLSTTGAATGNAAKWRGGVLGPDGKIYGIPGNAEVALIIDTTNNDAVSSLATTGAATGSAKWVGGVLGPNGKIYGIPRNAEVAIIIDTATNFTNVTANYLSAYRNKF